MPLKSKAQAGYLAAHNPRVFKEFAKATPKGTRLPAHVRKTKSKSKKK